MEKDFFPDRSEEAKYNDKISEGDIVMICEKHKQKTAETKEDLTEDFIVIQKGKKVFLKVIFK